MYVNARPYCMHSALHFEMFLCSLCKTIQGFDKDTNCRRACSCVYLTGTTVAVFCSRTVASVALCRWVSASPSVSQGEHFKVAISHLALEADGIK